jgi:hypothetical protein
MDLLKAVQVSTRQRPRPFRPIGGSSTRNLEEFGQLQDQVLARTDPRRCYIITDKFFYEIPYKLDFEQGNIKVLKMNPAVTPCAYLGL